jgi:hypothetical protein
MTGLRGLARKDGQVPDPDPQVSAQDWAAHDDAVARGEPGYRDAATGFFVMTAAYLADRGSCCGNGCRHCPFG